jgi:hypothetical protein
MNDATTWRAGLNLSQSELSERRWTIWLKRYNGRPGLDCFDVVALAFETREEALAAGVEWIRETRKALTNVTVWYRDNGMSQRVTVPMKGKKISQMVAAVEAM